MSKKMKGAKEATRPEAWDAAEIMLRFIGEPPDQPRFHGLGARLDRAWKEMYAGYGMDPQQILTPTYPAEGYDEMVLLRDIEFFSTCEHHLLPFIGKAHVAYIPRKVIVGISKLARVVECFARRLQIQERLTSQINNALWDCLEPLGCGIVIEARHLCMTARGVQKQHSVLVTSALKGYFRDDARTRDEFLALINKGEGARGSAS